MASMFASSSGVTSSGLFETHSSRACSQPSASGGQTGQESAPPDQAGQSWANRQFSAEKRRLNRRELCDQRPPKPLRRMRYSEVPREGLEPSRPCGHRILSPRFDDFRNPLLARVCAETLVSIDDEFIPNRSVASEGSEDSLRGGPKGGPVAVA